MYSMNGVMAQFKRPSGFLGEVAGTIMANRQSNRIRNAWTVNLLDIQPDDKVLEIGFGPGLSIEQVCQKLNKGRVVGIDHSEIMHKQASRRNASFVRSGKARLINGSIEELKLLKETFHKIFSVNVWMFWDKPVEYFMHLKSILKVDGTIAITFQPRKPRSTNQDAIDAGNKISAQLLEAGFKDIKVEIKNLKPVCAVCVLANN